MEDQVDQSVEQTDTTPSVEESTSQVEASGAAQTDTAPEAKQEEKIGFNDPRHPDHTRFKELLDGQREYKSRFEEAAKREENYKRSIELLQQQMEMLKQQTTPKPVQQKEKFIEDLEKIDPAYAKYMQSLSEQASKTTQLEQRIAQYEQQQFAKEAFSRFDNLLATNKVPDTDKELYRDAVEAEIFRRESRGQKLGLNDLDGIFKQFHDKYSKYMEDRERQITAKYVTAKKSDSTPKGATGGAAVSPTAKKLAAGDIQGQAKWLADQIRQLKKPI